jgi:hypothetical protein
MTKPNKLKPLSMASLSSLVKYFKLTNITLDWKGLPGTKALAYLDSSVTKKKYSWMPNVIKLFTSLFY